MAHKSEYDKYYFFMVVAAVFFLLVNLYYYVHPFWRQMGWTHGIADTFVLKLRRGGVYSGPWKTKAIAIVLLAATLVTRYGKGKKTPWMQIVAYIALGGTLYFIPFREPLAYLWGTLAGTGILCWAFGLIGRNLGKFNEAVNDRAETFAQCETLMDTPDSVNIRTVYQYRQKMHQGWINVVNPFRGTK